MPKKSIGNAVADVAEYGGDMALAEKLRECGSWLEFKRYLTVEKHSLRRANFCKSRLCPMCNWRRSLKVFGQLSKVMDFLDEHTKLRYLFLTLTIRNVAGTDLRGAVDDMMKSWRKLLDDKAFKQGRTPIVKGVFRALEITRNIEAGDAWFGTYHPHIHAILAVPPSYFTQSYIKAADWGEKWRRCANLDYKPSVDVRVCKATAKRGQEEKSVKGAVAECAKYTVKGTDILGDKDHPLSMDFKAQTLADLGAALHHRRLVSYSGIFADARKALAMTDEQGEDLVHVETERLRDDLEWVLVALQWGIGGYQVAQVGDVMTDAKEREELERKREHKRALIHAQAHAKPRERQEAARTRRRET